MFSGNKLKLNMSIIFVDLITLPLELHYCLITLQYPDKIKQGRTGVVLSLGFVDYNHSIETGIGFFNADYRV